MPQINLKTANGTFMSCRIKNHRHFQLQLDNQELAFNILIDAEVGSKWGIYQD
jgi:hypothetical protein